MTGRNTAIVRRLADEAFNGRNWDVFDELHDPAGLVHRAGASVTPAAIKAVHRERLEAFPDLRWTIERHLEDGEFVTTHATWRGTHRGTYLGTSSHRANGLRRGHRHPAHSEWSDRGNLGGGGHAARAGANRRPRFAGIDARRRLSPTGRAPTWSGASRRAQPPTRGAGCCT